MDVTADALLTYVNFPQLSIQHFDPSVLKKAKTRDRSRPLIDVDKDYEGDVSDEESGASQEVKSKVHGHASNHVDKLQEITKAIRTFDRWV